MPKTQGQRFKQAIKKYQSNKETRAQRERVKKHVNEWLKERYAHSRSLKIDDYSPYKWAMMHAPAYSTNEAFMGYFNKAQASWREVGLKLRRYKNHYNQQHGGGSYRGTTNRYHERPYQYPPPATRRR